MDKKIAFIGLGVMGSQMASHLLDSGAELYVYNRTKSKADGLVSRGAVWTGSPKEAASMADVIFTIVGYPEDVEQVYLGKDGIIEGVKSGAICCDMTTTRPSLELKIAEALKARSVSFADAPVSGGDVGARDAKLTFMVGSDEETFDALKPYLSLMGKSINHSGGISMGQQTKMCNQIVISGTMIGVSEALVYAAKAGLDVSAMVETIKGGAAGCWTLDNLAPRVIKGDYSPGFMIDHFVKDMGIALEEASRMSLALPGLALVNQLYTALKGQDLGASGTQALVKAIESLSADKLF